MIVQINGMKTEYAELYTGESLSPQQRLVVAVEIEALVITEIAKVTMNVRIQHDDIKKVNGLLDLEGTVKELIRTMSGELSDSEGE